ncbi:Flavin-containing monooxygenase [Lasiodiplodia theobromae]|uniref:Flavin-containing monooxygenase n=1 Tax=Lasiodiplodia theobromae TaxID=45133 RepID=UPI0015C2D5FD|nr:Flavin-containing monooxygenase [Lasiodiplodia theobromae]KAF4534147.1 Flavin-containing monooxygenase [Lasiodiplodia theobromae]
MATDTMPFQTPQVPLKDIGGPLPSTPIPEDADHSTIASRAVEQLSNLQPSAMLHDAMWRDQVALTGTMRTFHSSRTISLAWNELTAANRPQGFSILPKTSQVMRVGPTLHWVEALFAFSLLPEGKRRKDCTGIIRVVPVGDEWKIWVICTLLEDIPDYGTSEKMTPLTPEESLKEREANSISSGKDHFDAVIIGGGQCGLSTASRLKALGVSHVVLDRNEEIGGNWLTRYKSFTLHTSKAASDLPYGGIFKPEDPYFLPSKNIADGYRRFVERWGLNFWTSCVAKKASWDAEKEEWTIEFDYTPPVASGAVNGNGTGVTRRTIYVKHLIFAMGGGGQVPKYADISNQDAFKGEVLHSVNYTTADSWRGKRGVVIGTANSAHDVATDMVNAGLASVTLIQRSRTPVFPESYYHVLFDPFYHEGTDVPLMDRIMESPPLAVTHKFVNVVLNEMASKIPDYFDKLEAAGFAVDREIDLVHCLYERMGGHFYDMGVADKIVNGAIKVKQGTAESFTEKGLRFPDGSELEADVIVYATGFVGNVRYAATEIVGKEIGARLDDFWGVDKEGELRGISKPMVGQKNVWYMGGDTRYARYSSRYLALQIKADIEGETLDVYRKTPGELPN